MTSIGLVKKKKAWAAVVSIDIGTWGSGYAYGFPLTIDQDLFTGRWEYDGEGMKTRTSVLVDSSGKLVSFGSEAQTLFEDSKEDTWELYSGFKMNLSGIIEADPLCEDVSKKHKRHISELLCLTLICLSEKAMKDIRSRAGSSSLSPRAVRWILTVPAIWTPKGKQMMRQAAKRAGFWTEAEPEQLLLCLEPEAAGVWCLSHGKITPKASMKYLVVDAGGGTVDFVGHEIRDDSRSVKEVICASGGPWGSVNIDKHVLKVLQSILGDEFLKTYQEEHPKGWLKLLRNIEEVKCKRTIGKSRKLILPSNFVASLDEDRIESSLESGFKGVSYSSDDGAFVFTNEFWTEITKEIISAITDHTKIMLDNPALAKCNFIFLVGGFAESDILRNSIEDLGRKKGIEVLSPPYSAISIIRGGAVYGCRSHIIQARVSPASYGIAINKPYEKGKDPEEFKYFDLNLKSYRCRNVYSEIVPLGATIDFDSVWEDEFKSAGKECSFPIFTHTSEKPVPYILEDKGIKLLSKFSLNFPEKRAGEVSSLKVEMQLGGRELLMYVVNKEAKTTEYIAIDYDAKSGDEGDYSSKSKIDLSSYLNTAYKFADEIKSEEEKDFLNAENFDFEYGKPGSLKEFKMLVYMHQGGRYSFLMKSFEILGISVTCVHDEATFLAYISADIDQVWILCSQSGTLSDGALDSCARFVKEGGGLAVWTWAIGSRIPGDLFPRIFGDEGIVQVTGSDGTNGIMKIGKSDKIGQFDRHPLTAGIPDLYEGSSISFPKDDKMPKSFVVLARTTGGRSTIAYHDPESPKRGRVVLDCAITKMCDCCRKNTTGVDRYIRNMTTWLLGLEKRAQYGLPLRGKFPSE